MSLRLKPIPYQTVVITGATSDIGRATARAAAANRAKCVLVARDEQALSQLVEEVRLAGGSAVHVVADAGDTTQLQRVTQTAIEQFGGYDTWINGAGVFIPGTLLDGDPADHARLFQSNFWGVVNGSLEAARYLRERTGQYGGAIINLGAQVSEYAMPNQGMYTASKLGVKGFTQALRAELEAADAPISVTLVKTAATLDAPSTSVSTHHAAQAVADSILRCAEHAKRNVYAGSRSKWVALAAHYAPRLTNLAMEANAELRHGARDSKRPVRYASHRSDRGSLPGAVQRPVVIGAAALGVALAAGALWRYGAAKPRPSRRHIKRLRRYWK